jgi:hypothetical protein
METKKTDVEQELRNLFGCSQERSSNLPAVRKEDKKSVGMKAVGLGGRYETSNSI